MGIKERVFSPLPREVSLEDLVPEDSFYRRLEAALDLSFVRDLVRPLYAGGGRPSVDPVVFFKLQSASKSFVAISSIFGLEPGLFFGASGRLSSVPTWLSA